MLSHVGQFQLLHRSYSYKKSVSLHSSLSQKPSSSTLRRQQDYTFEGVIFAITSKYFIEHAIWSKKAVSV